MKNKQISLRFKILFAFLFLAGINFIYLAFKGEYETKEILHLLSIVSYLLIIIMLLGILFGILTNMIRSYLYYKQEINYAQELIQAQQQTKSLIKKVNKERI